MNFTTHVLFGLLVAGIFFGKPEAIILVGIGSAIPDMDREYGFFREGSFRHHQIHRALFHNFLFIGILYLINPFVAVGAFLHTLLDALTTAKDRGIEWLFPFTRFVNKALYDEEGNKLAQALNDDNKIKFYQNDLIEAARKSDEDLKEYKPKPWRRTYGPALSAGLLDLSIGLGSLVLLVYIYALSKFGPLHLIDLAGFHPSGGFEVPLLLGSFGITLELLGGEIDRRREEKRTERHPWFYHALFGISLGLIGAALILGAEYNPGYVTRVLFLVPYYIVGAILAVAVAAAVLTTIPTKRLSKKEKGEEASVL